MNVYEFRVYGGLFIRPGRTANTARRSLQRELRTQGKYRGVPLKAIKLVRYHRG